MSNNEEHHTLCVYFSLNNTYHVEFKELPCVDGVSLDTLHSPVPLNIRLPLPERSFPSICLMDSSVSVLVSWGCFKKAPKLAA